MKVKELTIFKSEIIKETYLCLNIEGIGYVEITRNEAKKFKNRLKYQETRIKKLSGYITRHYKII
ncbi:hypothetical protein [Tenacibaculum maritimum]|uniref:hypothetical protein n=1 Tax=Tenacibaculum maritimum TaxID=107401 RepID=UPI001E3F423C|nr:hypothetical protein [Tenacibaculum maritimum]MCD9609780.1 hypothetical protein [Tenacibaculum maritimum]